MSQVSVAAVTVSDSDGGCLLADAQTISGSQWTHIGSASTPGGALTFSLSSSIISGSPTANRPSLLLLPVTQAACVIGDNECHGQVAGNAAVIIPSDIANEHSGLHIYLPEHTDRLQVREVRYYADSTLMYTSKSLQQFDTKMIPAYANEVSRVVIYGNAQQAIITEAPPAIPSDTFGTLLYRLWRQHQGILTVILAAGGLLLAYQLIKLASYALRHRYNWRRAHGFIIEHSPVTIHERHIAQLTYIFRTIVKVVERILLYGTLGITIIFTATTFAISATQISGESMLPHLNNKQFAFINLTPVTVAHLNNSVPKVNRGDIVAIRPGITSADTSELIVKRVIGLPGERVTASGGTITIFNASHPSGFNPDAGSGYSTISQNDDHLAIDITLGIDELFVAGDNRPVSVDSRDSGSVKIADVLGFVYGTPIRVQW